MIVEIRRLVILIIIISFLTNIAFSQEEATGNPIPQPVPPSPTASSLGRYGEIPVSMYTGIPQISIPIWEVSEGDIKMPISMSYHASGVRVEENASWVGLGWSLNAGGAITRSVRGKLDEIGYIYNPAVNKRIPDLLLNPHGKIPTECEIWEASQFAYLTGNGGYDSEPDVYYFNFNGITGKFVFDQDGVPYTLPFQKLKIEKLSLDEWRITTPDGIQYKFGTAGYVENSETYSVAYPYYGAPISPKNKVETIPYYPSTWYLKEIESPSKNKIYFDYIREDFETNSGISQQLCYNTVNPQAFSYLPSNSSIFTRYYGLRLSALRFNTGSVNFISTKQREDISLDNSNPNAYALEKIVIKDKNNTPQKKFLLNTDYFQSSDPIQNYKTKRLRLNSITETSGDEASAKPPFSFSYEDAYKLPSKISSSQDHWGYFNGRTNNDNQGKPTLIPTITSNFYATVFVKQFNTSPAFQSTPIIRCPDVNAPDCNIVAPTISTFQYQGADRTSDFEYAKTGMLTEIQYPTGGITTFEYESNDYDIKNYVYQQITSSINGLASCSDPSHPSTHNGNQCYVSPTLSPYEIIPENLKTVNLSVPFKINVSFNLDGNDNKCCKCGSPFAVFTDLTSNTILLRIMGFGGLQLTDQIIKTQIDNKTASYSHITGSSAYEFKNVQLISSHVYELKLYGQDCEPEECQEFPNCPERPYHMETAGVASFDYRTDSVTQYNDLVGGLRIKKIVSSASTTDKSPMMRKYVYKLSSIGDELKSSGVIIDNPVYFDEKPYTTNVISAKWIPIRNNIADVVFNSQTSSVYMLTSGSKFELGQTSGSFVGYKEVQELYCLDENCTTQPIGKKLFVYTSADDFNDINNGVFGKIFFNQLDLTGCPLPDPSTRGFAIKYAGTGQISPTENFYPYPSKTRYDWKRGLLISETTLDKNGSPVRKIENTYNFVGDNVNKKVISGLKILKAPIGDHTDNYMFFGRYDYIAAWNYKSREKITEINGGNEIITTRSFFYDNPDHAQLTRIEYVDSENQLIKTVNKYPGDATSISDLTASESAAINKLIIQNNISQVLENSKYLNGSLMNRTHIGFNDWGNGILKPQVIKEQVSNNPIETRIQFNKYDAAGNVLEQQTSDNIKEVYLWGYGSSFPVAKIVNTTYDIAKTYITQGDLDAPLNDAALRNHLNNLRNIPGALVTTYTYKPLVGMTSETNPNNRTKYYEYDPLGRLLHLKDHNQYIVKKYCYNYAGQTVDCKPTNLPNIYVRITHENTYSWYDQILGNVVARFFSDEAGTQPLSVSNLALKYNYYFPCWESSNSSFYPLTLTANGVSINIATNVQLQVTETKAVYNDDGTAALDAPYTCHNKYYLINSDTFNLIP